MQIELLYVEENYLLKSKKYTIYRYQVNGEIIVVQVFLYKFRAVASVTIPEISEEFFNVLKKDVEEKYKDKTLVFLNRVRPIGITDTLYTKYNFKGSQRFLPRTLKNIPFFTKAGFEVVKRRDGFCFKNQDYSFFFYPICENSYEFEVTDPPNTWCELADKVLNEEWKLNFLIKENKHNTEVLSVNVSNLTELSLAKSALYVYILSPF